MIDVTENICKLKLISLQELNDLVEKTNVNIQEALTLIITLKKIDRAQESV